MQRFFDEGERLRHHLVWRAMASAQTFSMSSLVWQTNNHLAHSPLTQFLHKTHPRPTQDPPKTFTQDPQDNVLVICVAEFWPLATEARRDAQTDMKSCDSSTISPLGKALAQHLGHRLEKPKELSKIGASGHGRGLQPGQSLWDSGFYSRPCPKTL